MGANLWKKSVYGAIYGGILGALTAFSYRISDPATFALWTIVSLVAVAVVITGIEWYGSKE